MNKIRMSTVTINPHDLELNQPTPRAWLAFDDRLYVSN